MWPLTLAVCSLYVLPNEDLLQLSGPDGNDSHHPPCGPGCLYASVEQLLDPSLRSKPIAVGGGVVLAASSSQHLASASECLDAPFGDLGVPKSRCSMILRPRD